MRITLKKLHNMPAPMYMLAKGWDLFYNFLIIFIVLYAFSPLEQGYFYTFSSFTPAAVVLESGFGYTILLFLSNEWGLLRISGKSIAGPETNLARFSYLARLSIYWHVGLTCVLFGSFLAVGEIVFSQRADDIIWRGPWVLMSFGIALQTGAGGLRVILDATNQLVFVQSVAIISGIIAGIVVGIQATHAPSLYIAGTYLVVRALTTILTFVVVLFPFRKVLLKGKNNAVNWKKEILPQQWRIGASWLCGFAVFYSMVPITFSLIGPIEAGRLGLTMRIFHAINMISMAWLYAVQPRMGAAVGKGNIKKSNELMRGAAIKGVITAVALGASTLIIYYFALQWDSGIGSRFLNESTIVVILITVALMQITNAVTAAVRFQKAEPFLPLSIATATTTLLATIYFSINGSLNLVVYSFSAVILAWQLPASYIIYKKNFSF